VIHEGDIKRGSGKPPHFDGTNYPYWKIRMSAHLQGIDWRVWEICKDSNYEVLAARLAQEQMVSWVVILGQRLRVLKQI